MARLIRLRAAWIAGAVILLVAAGGTGVFLHSRIPAPTRTSFRAVAKPSVGATTVTQATKVEVLTVVSTAPGAGASGQPVTVPITLRFNLAVDPSTAGTYFSVLPAADGKFTQGVTPEELVFTPAGTLPSGQAINVLLRKGFPSKTGVLLNNDYTFSFNTEVSSRDVVFQAGNSLARVVGAASGQTVTVIPQFGNQVPTDVKVDIFKGTPADLLAAQVHDSSANYLDHPIDHGPMGQISEEAIANGQAFSVSEPDGIYLLLAADVNGQYGALWVDFSQYGVVIRQDDQKLVAGGENLSSHDTSPNFNITFYDLTDAVQPISTGSFSGTGEFNLAYGKRTDIAVASTGGEDVVVPLAAPQTGADIKVVGDQSKTPQLFITTDRTAYQSGETVKFAGIARYSNDQAYTIAPGMNVSVWTTAGPDAVVVPVAADGSFAGSLPLPAAAFNQDGSDAQLTIYAGTQIQRTGNYSPFFTVVAALGPHAPVAPLTVAFDKVTYVASDTIRAAISGPASKSVTVTIYSTAHSTRPVEVASYPSPSSWGQPVQQPVGVNLDATGHATYVFKANLPAQTADQEVTLEATYGAGAGQSVGAHTAVVYQAANEVFILPSRTAYRSGDAVIAPFVVESTGGQRVASAPMSFELDKTDYSGSTATTTVVASGSVTTDAEGRGVVRTAYSGSAQSLTLRVKGQDGSGNAFVGALPIAFMTDPSGFVNWGQSDNLTQLSVLTDKLAYAPGDTAQLTVTSPGAEAALMSLERGRIHSYKWVQLAAGDNPVPITITPDLVPGFTLTFSYFRDGLYFTEGMPISVTPASKVLKITATADQKTYTKGQTAHVALTVTDGGGAPVSATLIADGYAAAMSEYTLTDRASAVGDFLTPAARGTNGSSSLLSIGGGGGRCGGGGSPPQAPVTNPGATAVWLPDVTTDSSGHATIDIPISGIPIRLVVVAATSETLLGQVQADLSVP